MSDPRAPERIAHGLDEIIRLCVLLIAAGHEDGGQVRYLALATDQARRRGRGAQAQAAHPPANLDPKPADLRSRTDQTGAHALLSTGAHAPYSSPPNNP